MAKKKKRPVKKAAPQTNKMAQAFEAFAQKLRDPEVQEKLRATAKARAEAKKDKVAEEYDLEPPKTLMVQGNLCEPDKSIPRRDRIQWYWNCASESVVIASYIKEDSIYTEDVLNAKPGARKGDWVIDVIGYNGSALFNQTVEEAKTVAEAILSAIGWEHEWSKHYTDPGFITEGGEMAEIPHDDPGPTVIETVSGKWVESDPTVPESFPRDEAGKWVGGPRDHYPPGHYPRPDPGPPEGFRIGKPIVRRATDEPIQDHINEDGSLTLNPPLVVDQPRIQTGLPKDGIDDLKTETEFLGNTNDNCIGEPVDPDPWTPPKRVIKDEPQA